MQKQSSYLSPLRAALLISILVALTSTAQAHLLCSEIFHQVPGVKLFSKNTPYKPWAENPYDQIYEPLERQSHGLDRYIEDHTTLDKDERILWFQPVEIKVSIPKSTTDLQALGYHLLRSKVEAYQFKGHDDSPVSVSTELSSIQELVNIVIEKSALKETNKQGRKDIETQLTKLVEKVGPAQDRVILVATVSERYIAAAGVNNRGEQLTVISIINRKTGIALSVNILDNTNWL